MIRLSALLIVSTVLASCSGGMSGGVVGDVLPHWAGGTPKDVPPRPGTPEYDAFRQKLDAEAKRDKSKDPPAPKADAAKKSAPQ